MIYFVVVQMSPISLQSAGADDSHSAVVTGATSFKGQFCERGPAPCGHHLMEQDTEQLCGWGSLRPRALQVFNTPPWVLFFLSMAFFLHGLITNGLVGTAVTSIERRFDLRSSQIGLIVSSFDIVSCVSLPFVSYFGDHGHKPRWLGWGIVIMAVGSLVFALPHFTTPPYEATLPERSDMCPSNTTYFSQHQASEGLSDYFYVFVLGQILQGIGSTPLFTLGFTFLEENVQSNNAPVFMGIFYTAAMLGPAVGFLLGGFLISFYTEITLKTELTPASPLWVGAWWIGFVLAGALSLPVAFAILGYPKKVPGSQDATASCQSEDNHSKDGSHSSVSNPQFGKTLKDMPRSFLLLLKNPTFMFLSLGGATVVGLNVALSTFMIKYLESQFGLTSSQASLIFGVLLLTTAPSGTLMGSYVVRRFQLHCRGIIRFCLACCLVTVLLSFCFLIQCPIVSMAGVTVPYSSGQLSHVFEEGRGLSLEHTTLQGLSSHSFVKEELMAQCNSNCSCDRQLFSPVCGADDVMYYSPCYAGCTSINLTGPGEVFTDCSCVKANVSWDQEGLAALEKCVSSCSGMPVFITIFVMFTFCNLMFYMPIITATLRCVPETQKSFALGIQWILMRTLGSIPGPIVLGSLIDQACLLRQSEGHGSCFIYENGKLSHYTLLNCVIYRVVGAVFFILALVFLKAPESAPELTDQSNKTPPQDAAVKQQTCL